MTIKEKLYSYHQSLLILAAGLSLTMLFFFLASNDEQRGMKEKFLLQSGIQSQDLNLSLTQLIGKVDAIHGYIRNKLVIEPGTHQQQKGHKADFDPLSHIRFQDFLFLNTSSEGMNGWQTYAWFPKIDAEQLPSLHARAKSDSWTDYTIFPATPSPIYPVYYIDTKEPSRYPMGYNISDNLHFHNAILRSPDSPIVIQSDESGNATIGFLKPVYKYGLAPKNSVLREQNLLGFVFGEWQLNAVISPILAKYQWNDRSIMLTDKASGITLWRSAGSPVSDISLSEKMLLNIGGTELIVEFKAGSEFIANHTTQYALRVLITGIILTLMLAYYLFLLVNRQKIIEWEVEYQTSAYRQTYSKLESLLENFKGGIVFENAEHKVVLTNKCIYELLCLDDSLSLIGQGRTQWIQALQKNSSHPSALKISIDQESPVSGLTVKTRDSRYLEIDFIPIHHGSRHEGNIWILRNVTEKELMHQQLEHSQRLEGMGLLAGGIAHDFNNILTAIIGNTALIERKQKQGLGISEYLGRINSASDKAANLCRQMLAYSGRGQFIVQKLNIAHQVKEITDFLKVSLSKSIMIELDLDNENLVVQADATQVQQIVLNLVKNAADAIEGNSGLVRVSTYRHHFKPRPLPHYLPPIPGEGDYLVLEVSDNGCGMSSETQQQIFEPFFTTKQDGHGFGMSAVLGIIRGHDGFIVIDSEINRGTTFQVCFPLCESEDINVPDQTRTMKPLKGRVLLVDDEADILEAATAMLEEHGMEVTTAVNGVDALEKFQHRHTQIDLTIMDLSMPLMGGIECMQQMRNIDTSCKIILTSGFHESEIREKLTDLNHTQFLQKPYHPDVLINSIQL